MKSRRLTASILTAALLCGISGSVMAAVEKGPYLIYEDNNTEMTVLWQLSNSPDCEIKWGTDASCSDGIMTVPASGDNMYKAVLSGLQPGTRYYYSVNNGVGTGKFWAAPAEYERNIKFLGWGDSRTNPNITSSVMDEILKLDDSFFTFAMMAGDWTHKDREEDWSSQHFNRKYDNNIEIHTMIPLMGCRGNHEKEAKVFNKYYPYDFVQTGNSYYAFEYGPVKIITIDQYTNFKPGSTQYKWVENELASTAKPFKIIQAHEPAWTSGKHSNNIDFQELQKLFEMYDVAMVFCGHNHVYTRCKNGEIHHITSGGAGAGADPGDDDGSLKDPKVVVTETCEHFIMFEVFNGTELRATVIDERGKQIDTFSSFAYPHFSFPLTMKDVFETVKAGNNLNIELANYVIETDGDPLTFVITGLPAWATEADGIITGTPSSNDVGTVVADVTVSDKDGSDTATLTITVTKEDTESDLPRIDAGPDMALETPSGTMAMVTLTATASENDVVWKQDGIRIGEGATIDIELPIGVHTIVARVKDSAGNVARDDVVVTVVEIPDTRPNKAPVFKSSTILSTKAKAGKSFSKDISKKAKDADGDKLTFSKVNGPAWLKVAANGKLSGTPAKNDKGNNKFTIKVSDGKGGEDTAAVKVKVK